MLDLPKNWCFWTVVLEKSLESPLDCKEIQPVHPKGNSPEYSLEGLMLKLKLQYFGHLMRGTNSLEKSLMLEKIEVRRGDNRGWDGWMALLVMDRQAWRAAVHGSQRVRHNWATEQNWPATCIIFKKSDIAGKHRSGA